MDVLPRALRKRGITEASQAPQTWTLPGFEGQALRGFCDGQARIWQVLATCVEWSGKGCFIPARRVGGSRPPSDAPERRGSSRMRIDWYMLQSPARLAQPLVNPHQSAVVMVNAQADAQGNKQKTCRYWGCRWCRRCCVLTLLHDKPEISAGHHQPSRQRPARPTGLAGRRTSAVFKQGADLSVFCLRVEPVCPAGLVSRRGR